MSAATGAQPRQWRGAILTAAALAGLAAQLAPQGVGADAPPSPDFFHCALFFFCLRRPDAAPLLLVFALGALRDVVAGGPFGAGLLATLIASEALKAQAHGRRRMTFLLEWPLAALAAALTLALPWALMTLSLAPTPPPAALALPFAATAAAYPLVSVALRFGLGVGAERGETREQMFGGAR